MTTPIVLTLYNPADESVSKTLTRSFIPWKMLKQAIRLNKQIGSKPTDQLDESDIDAIAEFICSVFGQDLTPAQLDEQSEVSEMMTVLRAIVTRARGVMDPTLPPKAMT